MHHRNPLHVAKSGGDRLPDAVAAHGDHRLHCAEPGEFVAIAANGDTQHRTPVLFRVVVVSRCDRCTAREKGTDHDLGVSSRAENVN